MTELQSWQRSVKWARWLIRWFAPPVVAHIFRSLRRNPPPTLEYLQGEWDSVSLDVGQNGWNIESTVSGTACERAKFERDLANGAPLGIAHEHNLHVSFAFVVALAAREKTKISILDWGAGLGQYCNLAKVSIPGVGVDYHCKEVPVLATAGQRNTPGAVWYMEDSCLKNSYDLVFASGSLQYAKDWKELLVQLAAAAREYLFLTRIPVVFDTPNYCALQHVYGSTMVFWVFNQSELVEAVRKQGFELIREFLVQDWPAVQGAPEQCELRGWLFRRSSITSAAKEKA